MPPFYETDAPRLNCGLLYIVVQGVVTIIVCDSWNAVGNAYLTTSLNVMP